MWVLKSTGKAPGAEYRKLLPTRVELLRVKQPPTIAVLPTRCFQLKNISGHPPQSKFLSEPYPWDKA